MQEGFLNLRRKKNLSLVWSSTAHPTYNQLIRTLDDALNHRQRSSRESFFSKIRNFWAWVDKLGWNFGGYFGYFQPNYWHYFGQPNYWHYFGTMSPLFMGKCSWIFFLQKYWFLNLKHITPKYSQNKILAVKNLEKSLHTFVFGVQTHL